ncbi:MAG: ABC-F family ATP-binding cassette domain-containing protein [Spirochaetia bacterium]
MLTVSDITLSFGNSPLFKDVNLRFQPGNCYGLIGANGSGKSTFLRILSGEIEPDAGNVHMPADARMAVLRQDQNAFDDFPVMETVVMGYERLHAVKNERDALYAKEDFSEADGLRASELEAEFGELGGWEAEAEAATLLDGLGLDESFHERSMSELEGSQKVRVLLAQALFGKPDILLLDEPTNNLDLESISWLEDFLYRFENTVIVVSHDRHFLNRVCTHIADIDFGRIRLYVGNYDFWYSASRLAARQKRDERKKSEEKAAELKAFIQRFSSNASKAKQATARKKQLEQLELDDLPQSSRRFPYVAFKPAREPGKNVLSVEHLDASFEGEQLLRDFSLTVNRGDKIAFVGSQTSRASMFFDVISGEREPDAGTYSWGVTIQTSYFPNEAARVVHGRTRIVDWLKTFAPEEDTGYLRGFLGRMLFSGDDALKPMDVLSGGERVRVLLAKMMLESPNVLIMDDPTNHLDLESIQALNNGLIDFEGVVLFTSHDHQFVDSIANRIIELTPNGMIDRLMRFDDYMENADVQARRDELYRSHERVAI